MTFFRVFYNVYIHYRIHQNELEGVNMPRLTRLQIAKNDIKKILEETKNKIFTPSDIAKILSENRGFLRLPVSLTSKGFTDFLKKEKIISEIELKFPNRKYVRYLRNEVSVFEIALSLHPNTYISHYSAIYLHQLTEQFPKTIYINLEQPKKTRTSSELSQERIDFAFKGKQRVSKNRCKFHDNEICILNGKFTGNFGIIKMITPDNSGLSVTGIERTLIDSVVRPEYSGGVFEILKAFENAKDILSINEMLATLKTIDYTYPYHQAIGFYLERAGYPENKIKLVERMERQYDFYLTYNMKETEYSRKWKLFYPKGF